MGEREAFNNGQRLRVEVVQKSLFRIDFPRIERECIKGPTAFFAFASVSESPSVSAKVGLMEDLNKTFRR